MLKTGIEELEHSFYIWIVETGRPAGRGWIEKVIGMLETNDQEAV